MKKSNITIAIALIVLAVSCAQPVPNPLAGSYTMPNRSNQNLDDAALALKLDGTFVYVEQISSSSEYQIRIDGTYDVSLNAYNFLSASGIITFNVPDGVIPENITHTIIGKGATSFLFDWSCDKDRGPLDLTLVVDANDVSKNYEFEYIGSSDKLDSIHSVLPAGEGN